MRIARVATTEGSRHDPTQALVSSTTSARVPARKLLYRVFLVALFIHLTAVQLYLFCPSKLQGVFESYSSEGPPSFFEADQNTSSEGQPPPVIEADPLKEEASRKALESLVQEAKRRAANVDSIYPSGDKLPWIKQHPLLSNLTVPPNADWKEHRFPDISIIGLPKAGTSNLYKILTGHPAMVPYDKRHKESCTGVTQKAGMDFSTVDNMLHQPVEAATVHGIQQGMNDYFNNTGSKSKDKVMTVNGCLLWAEFFLQYHYIQPRVETKVTLLFRDPADWIWSSWNFWVDLNADAVPPDAGRNWANEEYHYRSPELFHEYMLAGEKSSVFRRLLHRRAISVMPGRIAKALLGPERVLFVRKEDMEPDVIDARGGFLDQVSQFLGVNTTTFAAESTHAYTNCNAQKGEENLCSKASNAYPITGGRPMLEKTRELIYLSFAEECRIWAEEFGVVYPDCLAVRQRLVTEH